jgi:uncharacterized protein
VPPLRVGIQHGGGASRIRWSGVPLTNGQRQERTMPIAPTYPGVYIEEVPSGVRTIVGVATSTGAFIDRFARGPLDVAIRIFSYADFERAFGGLNTLSAASYALQQFFLNGGTEAYVVRVGTDPLAASEQTLTDGATDMIHVIAGRRVAGVAVADPGVWGDSLRIEIDYDTTAPDETFNLTIQEVALENGRQVVRRSESYRNLTMEAGEPNYVLDVVNEDSVLVQLDRDGMADLIPFPTPAPRPDATGTLGAALVPVDDPLFPGMPAEGATFTLTVDVDGTGGTTIAATATIAYGGSPVPLSYAGLRPFIESAIRAAAATVPAEQAALDEWIRSATVQLAAGRFRVLLGRAGRTFNPDAEVTFGGAADLGLTGAGVSVGPQQVRLENGADSGDLTSAALIGVLNDKTGMFALEDADIFNILCIPAAADLTDFEVRDAYARATAYCEERRAFLIVDIPDGTDTLDGIMTWLGESEGLRHRNAAVYFPRPRIADPLNQGRLRSVGASGTMAGLYARTDAERGVWKAPAGTEARLRNVQDLDYPLTDRENGALNPLGVNALRSFPIFGMVAWGGRTLDGADQIASEWKYIPVRRLALFLEETLFRGLKWVVFEPNDEPLWSQIRLNVGAFMQNLFRQGAFQGSTPRDAYFVKVDSETTTQNDINLGIVNIVVGFAPLKPAEFVVIRIQQMAGQIET